MKTLVYSVAIGEEFVPQARLMVKSLRTFGQYSGDVWVYGEEKFEGAERRQHVGYDELSHWPAFNRILAGAYDGMDYDKVMYVDADVLFVAPIAEMWDWSGKVGSFEEGELVGGCERHYLERGAFPQPGKRGLNSGTIMADGKAWPEICKGWLTESRRIRAHELRCKDQHSWNTMILRGNELIQHRPLPREWAWFPGEQDVAAMTAALKLIHVNGANKILMMRTLHALLLRERA